jgi:hypothetical protein
MMLLYLRPKSRKLRFQMIADIFKAYKELERIKTARQKQPQPPDQSKEERESDKHPAINLYWINPETGERTLAAQTPKAIEITERLQRNDPPS